MGDDGKENGKESNRSKKQQKKTTLYCTCSTFFVHFLAVVLHEYNAVLNFLVYLL